ncbi:unnamed protein product [Rangifer tarandus platyrhynchus]|uniref:Uncharacterized protein n=2 Tax=Rangifer tarandus platyrhynchus TaxID=3082113 RepID=A0ABN8Y6I1_RANTA|nr:unnamed protein product [Rangifer tarandus platyrhynchus]CAI9695257.1 unnamed protein product [Rangifer tarandus platyrhynchus]
MLRSVWQWLCVGLCSLLLGQAEAPTPVEPPERSRPYAVLRGQNLGEWPRAGGRVCAFVAPGSRSLARAVWTWGQLLMGTIFSLLLVTVILMAFCVYKPIRRR